MDLDGLRVPRQPRADHLVVGSGGFSAGISRGDIHDALEPFENAFHSPEAAAGEDCASAFLSSLPGRPSGERGTPRRRAPPRKGASPRRTALQRWCESSVSYRSSSVPVTEYTGTTVTESSRGHQDWITGEEESLVDFRRGIGTVFADFKRRLREVQHQKGSLINRTFPILPLRNTRPDSGIL